ncbi:hypothetical protein SAMN05428970_1192 [Agromyces sp. CF514]|uniref:hypothetical protein n=1 Tax=Agromyces sp. CF514 TaxID=1881031 RepID=UPI0008F003F7|nr:hypothetical protein [Agromyces sp. CF514]SFR71498.1 hypothetical protein SAMN05428970_1192 [Agromyces sp. CF514]
MEPRTPVTARLRRSTTTIVIGGALSLLLSACASGASGSSGAGASASVGVGSISTWLAEVGTRWEAFVDGNLAPLTDTGIAVAGWLVGLAVAARLVTLMPWVRDPRITRAAGRRLRIVGWALVAATPIATVIVTAFARDALFVWMFVGGALAVGSVVVLAFGLATRSRIDAHVMSPDGSTNSAWSIDALLQMRDLNADDPGHRVDRQDSPDFGEFITVADRSGNGLASVAAWVVQVLFNAAPWMLQVTMVDPLSAIATLRRNGHLAGEVHLRLDSRGFARATDAGASDQHRKLLALAAAFTAMTMADRYPDVRGFYRATNWRSLGYLAIAQMADDDDERDHYLDRAVEIEPRSLIVEYTRVQVEFVDARDRHTMEALMDRLEPVVNQAAWVCDTDTIFQAPPRDWHEYTLRERATDAEGRPPFEVVTEAERSPSSEGDEDAVTPVPDPDAAPDPDDPPRGEPHLMLLRTLLLYVATARNWAALVDLEPGSHPVGDDGRRERIRRAADALVRLLDVETAARCALTRRESVWLAARTSIRRDPAAARRAWERREHARRDPAGVLMRMRARAALSYVIFDDGPDHEQLVAAADPTPSSGSRAAAMPRLVRPARGPRPTREPVDILTPWLAETKASGEIEIRYSYACYLARRSRTAQGDAHAHIVDEAARRVEAAQLVDQYRSMAEWDPELKHLGTESCMRSLVVRPIRSSWEIRRFATVRSALVAQGILEPDRLAATSGRLDGLLEATELHGDEFGRLLDASSLLRAIETTDVGGLAPDQRLRAARHLVDTGCSVSCLLVRVDQDPGELVAELAAAVFWVPTDDEVTHVREFVTAVARSLADERAAAGSSLAGATVA